MTNPSKTTDDNGRYLFDQLRPGQYVVRIVVQDGWEQTYPGAGGATAFTYTGSDAALFMPGEIQFPGIAPDQLAARLDVNGDGYLSPVDALLIINALNAAASDEDDPAEWQPISDSRDVNGDGVVSPLDALLVINRINEFGTDPIQRQRDSDSSAGELQPCHRFDRTG